LPAGVAGGEKAWNGFAPAYGLFFVQTQCMVLQKGEPNKKDLLTYLLCLQHFAPTVETLTWQGFPVVFVIAPHFKTGT
jgi:hypothetical protein